MTQKLPSVIFPNVSGSEWLNLCSCIDDPCGQANTCLSGHILLWDESEEARLAEVSRRHHFDSVDRHISIGFGFKDLPPQNQLGANKNSYAWRADGKFFKGEIEGKKFPTADSEKSSVSGYKVKDIVGCGLILNERKIFFTKNGVNLGVAISGIDLGIDSKEITRTFDQMEQKSKDKRKAKRGQSEMAGILSESTGLFPAVCLQ